jgi:hypothetical protein
MYEELENLLFRGFLLCPIEIMGVPILLKSLTEQEFKWVDTTYHYLKNPEDKFLYYTAYSFAQIDGSNILEYRDTDLVEDMLSLIRSWHAENFMEVSMIMDEFRVRMFNSLDGFEPYVYTDRSRSKWHCYKNHLLNDPRITGWKGTENLGLSSTQESWVTFNVVEDLRMTYETHNDAARFIATAVNPKGMKPINEEEVSRRKRELDRREGLVKGGEQGEVSLDALGKQKHETMSGEQMAAEVNRMIAGDKDTHDDMIAQYERKMKEIYLEEKKKRESLVLDKMERNTKSMFPVTSVSRILDDGELEELRIQREERAYKAGSAEPEEFLAPDTRKVSQFQTMAKLDSEEDERYLQEDLLLKSKEDLLNSGFTPTSRSGNVVESPSFNDYKSQQSAWRKQEGYD